MIASKIVSQKNHLLMKLFIFIFGFSLLPLFLLIFFSSLLKNYADITMEYYLYHVWKIKINANKKNYNSV